MCYSAESNLQNKTFLKKYRGNLLVNVKVCAILSELIPIQGFSYDYSPGSGPSTTELIISRLPLKIIKITRIIIIKNTDSNRNYPHAFNALEIGGITISLRFIQNIEAAGFQAFYSSPGTLIFVCKENATIPVTLFKSTSCNS